MRMLYIPLILLFPLGALSMIGVDSILEKRSERTHRKEVKIQEIERRIERIERKMQCPKTIENLP